MPLTAGLLTIQHFGNWKLEIGHMKRVLAVNPVTILRPGGLLTRTSAPALPIIIIREDTVIRVSVNTVTNDC